MENFGNGPKYLKNFREIFGIAAKLSENFGNGSKFFSNDFMTFLKVLENFRKYAEVFGNIQKFSENFGNVSKVKLR